MSTLKFLCERAGREERSERAAGGSHLDELLWKTQLA